MNHATMINDNAQQSVAGQKRTASVEQASGIFSSLIGETSVTQRWVVGINLYAVKYRCQYSFSKILFLARRNIKFSVSNASEYISWP